MSSSTVRRARRLAARLPARWDRRVREVGKVLLDYNGARSGVPRAALFRLLRRLSPLVATPYGKGLMLVDTGDREVGRTVFVRGEYERRYLKAAIDYLSTRTKLGPVFVDVGANIGTSTLDALLEFGFPRAVCFEPDARNHRLLRLNVVLNELEDRVATHHLALSDANGEAVLQRAPGNSGDSRLLDATTKSPHGESVEIRTFDSLVADGLVKPEEIGMLWIDAQGHDARILAGARETAGSGFPVVVEYWPEGLGADGIVMMERLVAELFASVVDLRHLSEGAEEAGFPSGEIGRLRSEYRGSEFTDLLLLR